ncbi:unnamed protein product [Rotaria sp. Silwood2]|nr:unnamed protein product [Rotaria sp. Silwood2]CAF3141077.1 unnamed protein product [Rotaria sp. Silwood2]CAF3454265.1 unnamed protein product [Rotaria sp. Silwood2]
MVILVPHADVNVDMGESGTSKTTIATDYLGPCLCFLFDMKFFGDNVSFISHYSFSINDEKLSPSELLIKILEYLVTELRYAFQIPALISEKGQSYFSNVVVLIAGGDPKECKNMHNALCMLNSNDNNFNIENECEDNEVRFLYYKLKKRIIIIKSVSKMLKNKDEFAGNPPDLRDILYSSNIKIGINGFNRIGRLVLRCALEQGIQVIAVNDPDPSACLQPAVHMVDKLKFDSANAYFKGEVFHKDKFIVADQVISALTVQRQTYVPPWDELGVEYVVETICKYTTIDEYKSHLQAGARRVIITVPSADAPVFVMGVNEDKYTGRETVLSSTLYTTANCLAPLVKVVHEKFGIVEALITTLSSSIRVQETVDEPSDKSGRSREAEQNILFANNITIDKAIGKIIPDLNEKLTGTSFIFPTLNVSLIDLTARLNKGTKYEEICAAIREAANGPLKNILAYSDDNSVPTHDIVDKHSLIFYAQAGILLKDNFVKLVSWCNNEYSDANRVMDLIKYIFKKDYEDKLKQSLE